ncbi:hypothetical protein [Microbacterium faecale]|uniref:hypothetical protein n=1 Tax=Microbacterium faecale TaxID=1804630 RepID=UPI001E2B8B6F|nr:hypothetical protein [Microbacterium faecale]
MNRTVLFGLGLVLLVAGGGAVLASVWSVATGIWESWTATAVSWMQDAAHASRVSEATTLSGVTIAALALVLVIVVGAMVVIVSLGGGRSSVVVRDETGDGAQGPVVIRQRFASDAITRSLAARGEILTSQVSASRVRGTDVLHVSVTPRRNTSPVDVAATVTRLVDNLATLTGRETPTLISIHSSVRARLAADQSRVD